MIGELSTSCVGYISVAVAGPLVLGFRGIVIAYGVHMRRKVLITGTYRFRKQF